MELIEIQGEKVFLTQDPSKFPFLKENVKKNLEIVLDIMNNCIDVVYDLERTTNPEVYRPELYLSSSMKINAHADYGKKRIIVNLGLIRSVIPLISRYNKETLEKYQILSGEDQSSVQSGVRVHFWRFVILHELYHLYNGHSQWNQKYTVTEDGEIVISNHYKNNMCSPHPILSEANRKNRSISLSKSDIEKNIVSQALELDADSSAVCMLINLLFFDMRNRKIEEQKRQEYIKIHIAYIMAGIASAFCLFNDNVGSKFEELDELNLRSHPIPAIRFVFAEEITETCLRYYIVDEKDLVDVEVEWQKIVCDIEAEYNGVVDMGQVFFFPAYTEIGQQHLYRVRRRLNDMHDTLKEFAVGSIAPKLSEDELRMNSPLILFDKRGKSLRGWTNPATGKHTAVRSDKMPAVATRKPGRNEPCPCGSGKKYKKCCGSNK